jgi:hypothetical protein
METWKIGLIGGGVILLIVLIAVGIYFLTRKEDTTPAPTTSRSPSGTTTSSPSNTTTSSPSGPTSSPSPGGPTTTPRDTLAPTTSPSPAPARPRYYLAKQCPTGFRDRGQYGLLISPNDKSKSPFGLGGTHVNQYANWTWAHPKLCFGIATDDQLKDLYGFTEKGFGPDNQANLQMGIIQSKDTMENDIFEKGVNHNEGWDWRRPYLQSADKPGTYLLETTGDTKIGIIVHKVNVSESPFDLGGEYNLGWDWSHPYLNLAKN